MSYILALVLFNGTVSYEAYSTAAECNAALYRALDTVFLKNINSIECIASSTVR